MAYTVSPFDFVELFLRPTEKEMFATWEESVTDRSISTRIWGPVFDYFASFIPDNVAPNVLSLAGSLAIIQAWYFCTIYGEIFPQLASFISVASIFVMWALGGIDGRHARRTLNDTALGELFKYVCDNVSTVFLIVILCNLLGGWSYATQWYCVQLGQLLLLVKHHSAFVREAGIRYWLVGPGELLLCMAGLLVIRGVCGWQWMYTIYDQSWGVLARTIMKEGLVSHEITPSRMLYFTALFATLVRVIFQSGEKWFTRRGLLFVLLLRAGPAMFLIESELRVIPGGTAGVSQRDVIVDGLFLGVVTSDLIVAKMARRELHYWIILMSMATCCPHVEFVSLCLVVFYYTSIFCDLMTYMNLPLLSTCQNVYCDGVYDLCHIGHKNLFRNALKFGNRLFVGVCNDEDCSKYKRPPVMSAAEREAEVANCKCVTKVIPDAPTFGLTKEFLTKHRIHIVAFGQEYLERYPDPKDDPYYSYPRSMGMAKPLPRTDTLSTSELIRRVQGANLAKVDDTKLAETQASARQMPEPDAKRQKCE